LPGVSKFVYKDMEVEAFVHATESAEAVERAIRLFAPRAQLKRETLGGHFGQSLLSLRARVVDPSEISEVIDRIRAGVGPEVARTAARRIDEDLRLHFRFDKQRASRGEIAFDVRPENDVVKMQVRLRSPGLDQSGAVTFVQRDFEGKGLREEE